MNDFHKLLEVATSCVDSCYFQTEIIGKNSKPTTVYRERIYCYELYHQMRKIWPQDDTLVLHGDYDKSGSQFFGGTSVKGVKPDFLIHTPGIIDKNLLAMEVKAVTAKTKDVQCDLRKLSRMRSEANYFSTIFLMFGNNAKIRANKIKNLQPQWGFDSNLEIWAHENANEAAIRL